MPVPELPLDPTAIVVESSGSQIPQPPAAFAPSAVVSLAALIDRLRAVASPVKVAAVIVGCGLGLALVVGALKPSPPSLELSLPRADAVAEGGPVPGASAERVVVHAAGALVTPGVYRLASGARVGDLLEAAGGPLPDANLDALNLAQLLADGERVYVPRQGEETPAAASASSGSAGHAKTAGPVNLNTATAEDLDGLPGVGPATASAIIEHRTRAGRFRSVDDLLDVPGIGEAKLERLRSLVRV
ncbi:MAG TPA: helix-hairpin-helix domain-containing protein [Acidimicrobiales bacterium]|nr:helix-hairpin-helix domain-containing protein [Acidimicrobiales bacterium]